MIQLNNYLLPEKIEMPVKSGTTSWQEFCGFIQLGPSMVSFDLH